MLTYTLITIIKKVTYISQHVYLHIFNKYKTSFILRFQPKVSETPSRVSEKKKENVCTHVLETFPMIPVPPLKAAGLISSSGGKDVKESMMKV